MKSPECTLRPFAVFDSPIKDLLASKGASAEDGDSVRIQSFPQPFYVHPSHLFTQPRAKLLQSIPVERESRWGDSSLKSDFGRRKRVFPQAKSFAVNILPLSPLDGRF
jgi:hypothetical protein